MIFVSILAVNSSASDGESREAVSSLTKATYKYHGIDKYVRKLEKQYLSDDVRVYGGWMYQIGKTVVEKRITYEVTF